MTNQRDDLRQWIQELISRSAADQMQNLKRFEEMLRRSMLGELDQTRLREEYLRFAQQESTRYINDLTRVGMSFYNTLLELNRHYNDRFFEQVLKAERSADVAARREPRQTILEISGPLDGDASRSFVIENQRSEPMAISFLISEFASQDGAENFRPPLQIGPARFSLSPGEERLVTVKVSLLKEFFAPGQVYSATVLVSGFEEMQLLLKVWADLIETSPAQAKQAARKPVFYPVDDDPLPAASAVDDLKRIKGIGPAVERKLRAGGVQNFARLAQCDYPELERLLGASLAQRGLREQWREQARLAEAGDWAALNTLRQGLA